MEGKVVWKRKRLSRERWQEGTKEKLAEDSGLDEVMLSRTHSTKYSGLAREPSC